MKRLSPTLLATLAGVFLGGLPARAAAALIHPTTNGPALQVLGDRDDEWRFESSTDLVNWAPDPAVSPMYSDAEPQTLTTNALASGARFYRAEPTTGLFDPWALRTIRLTFTNANWVTLLTSGRTSGVNTPALLAMDNGVTAANVGARYKGNSSFTMGGTKKSINLDINAWDADARVMGYRAINLNNAAGDPTIMREPVYFNVMRRYAPSPQGALAKLYINGAYWGVYSLVDQQNNDLLDEWFPSHEGDRWRAPNVGGMGGGPGGGGFSSGASAFSFLGTNISSYTRNYELKSDNSTNAWRRLVQAITVLHHAPTNELRDAVETVFAVDRWLWFFALENIFADDDSYWNKGADYGFYYEPESGRIHPVEHDGNEAFAQGDVSLSPVMGVTGTNRPLVSKLLNIPELRQRYLAHLRTATEESFHPSVLVPMINRFHLLSVADISKDPKKNYSMAAYTNDLRSLRLWVTNRYRFLTNYIELRPRPPLILAVTGPSPPPAPTEAPTITAAVQAQDDSGLDSVWLYWRDQPYGRFLSTQMRDDGEHGDGAAGDGVFGAVTTNYTGGHKIHYYVEARSANATKTAAFSPARAEQETLSYRVALAPAESTPVVINELMADNTRTLADPQGEFDDWIELHNVTDEEIDLGGRYLTDNPDSPRKWKIPADTKIPGRGYLLVWADENGNDTPGLHANFRLAAGGEQLLLVDTDANENLLLDSVTFGEQLPNVSFGRTAADPAEFSLMSPTPGGANR